MDKDNNNNNDIIYLKGTDIIEIITPGVISNMKTETIFERAKAVKNWTRLSALTFLKDYTENLEREKNSGVTTDNGKCLEYG